MSRKEDFKKAANDYVEGEPDGAQKIVGQVGFEFGAEYGYLYAQTHPNWISVEEEPYPPKKNKWDRKSKEVFIHGIWQGKPKTLTGTYHYDIDDWGVSGVISTITHWMEIVPPRKEEQNNVE